MSTPHFGPGLIEIKQGSTTVGYGWIKPVSATQKIQHWVFGPSYAAPNTVLTWFLPKDPAGLGITDVSSFYDEMEELWGSEEGTVTVHGNAVLQPLPDDPGSIELDYGTVQIVDSNQDKVGELYADGSPATANHWVTHGSTVGWDATAGENQALGLEPVSGLGYKSVDDFLSAMVEYLADKSGPHRYEVESMTRYSGVQRP